MGVARYTLANYMRDALLFDFPDWFYGIEMKRFDQVEQQLVGLEPWPHQKDDLNFLLQHERSGFYNDAGTGKTVPMQALGTYMAALGNKTIFCMPPKLVGQFTESYLVSYQGVEDHLKIFVLEEKQKEAAEIVQGWIKDPASCPDVVILSYEMFASLQPLKPSPEKEIKNQRTGTVYIRPAVKPLRTHPLEKAGFCVMIFDEAQKLKTPESASHKRVWRWVKSSEGKYMIVLATGTPIYNTLMDAYGLIRIVTPNAYSSKRHFERKHAIYMQDSDYPTIIGWQNEDYLNERLYCRARRVTKEEVLPDLPPMVPKEHRLNLYMSHKKLYKQLLTERVLELEDEFIDATNQSKLRQVAMQLISNPNEYSDTPIKNVMEDWLEEMFEEANIRENKVIVFAYYKSTVDFLAKKYASLNPAVINGANSKSEADRVRFVSDPECKVLFLNWKSGGAGLNLQVSHHQIFYEVPTVPGDVEQAIARCHRGGQVHGVSVYLPRVIGTLANKSLNQLLSKQLKKNEVVQDRHALLAELLGK